MKNRLGILTALILSLVIAGSAFASTGKQNTTQNNMTAKPKMTKMTKSTKKTRKHRRHRKAKMMRTKKTTKTAPPTK